MKYVNLGSTNVEFSRITMGAWAIGDYVEGGVEISEAIDAMEIGYDLGCTSIDTAPIYNIGLSEEVVGSFIKNYPRDKIKISTKCGVIWNEEKGDPYFQNVNFGSTRVDFYKYAGKESIILQCEESLRRLNTEYIDLYSIHYPDKTTPVEESMEAFEVLLKQGKILSVGLCNHQVEDLEKADKVTNVAANKVRYSMLNTDIEDDLIPYCLKNTKRILAYSILQRGILTGDDVPTWLWQEGYDNPKEVALYEQNNRNLINRFLNDIKPIALDNNATLSQLCINWTLNQPGISIGLLGATSRKQMVHDIQSLNISLSESEIQEIDVHLKRLKTELNLPNVKFRF